MNKKDIMYKFIKAIEKEKLLTLFIKNIFDYQNFYDYNYLFRITSDTKKISIDIYDNISENRFNRYIFIFSSGPFKIKTDEKNNVFITHIYIENVVDSQNKLLKLAYLFKLKPHEMIPYAKKFLDNKIVTILNNIITETTLK